MENDFKNLTTKVWTNLDDPIKSYDFSKLLFVCRPLMWYSATICDVTTVQLSNGTAHKFQTILLFMKVHIPCSFILRHML